MITGAIKNKVDKIWTDIWAGGITNPLTVIEQLTYLMFIRSLDEKEQETESLENMTGEKMPKIFPQSTVGQSMRWSKFKNSDPREIYEIISKRVFPSLKEMWNGQLPDFDEKTGELIPIPGSPADRAAKARKAAEQGQPQPEEELEEQTEDNGETTAFARYMSDALFLIPTPQVLQKIITGLDDLY